jgi:ABC-type amino acid transport substrate-binding protein
MDNVRAALAAVDRGTVDAAIVYRSDLRTPRGRRFYDYLFTDEAAKVFEAYGFGLARGGESHTDIACSPNGGEQAITCCLDRVRSAPAAV